MPKGFSNFKAFTSGVLGSLNEDTEIRKKTNYAEDAMKRELALKTSYLQEQEAMQEKKDQYLRNADMSSARQWLSAKYGSSTNAALQAGQQPQAQNVSQTVEGAQAPVQPTTQPVLAQQTPQQAPQVQPAVMQTVQNVPQQGTPSTQPQGGLNSPQGGPVSIQSTPQPQPQAQAAPDTTVAQQIADPENAPAPNKDLTDATITAFTKNYKPSGKGAPIGLQMQAAEDEAKDLLLARQGKQTEIDLKKAELEQKKPIDLTKQGDASSSYATVMIKKGIIGSPVQEPLTAGEKSESYKLVSSANSLKQSAENGVQSFVRSIGGAGKAYSGPLAGVLATAEGAWDQMTDTQRSESLQNYFKLRKETIQQLNAQIGLMRQQTGGGIRFGVKSMEMEEKGIPDPTKMGPDEVRQLGLEYINTYKSLIGTSNAIIDGGKHIHPLDRIQMANKYSDENPVTLEDGVTPNPNWHEWNDYKQAVMNDTFQPGATQETNRATQTNNITNNGGQANKVIPYTEYFK